MKIKILLLLLISQFCFSQNKVKPYGIIHVSVANIRSKPAQSAEMSTQALLGTRIKLIEKSNTNNWYLVELPDHYKGWVEGGSITRLDSLEYHNYEQIGKDLIVVKKQSQVFKIANKNAEIITELVWHNRLKGLGRKGQYWQVQLADGSQGYVQTNEVDLYEKWLKRNDSPNSESLIQTAHQLMGIPYLWGGTSIKGLDCSGFTKTIFHNHGLELPRDASQQAVEGILVDSLRNWDQLKAGDLIFFGEKKTNGTNKVVHVAIWEGNQNYIHASDRTRRSSMNPNSPDYDEYNWKRYLFAKRIEDAQNNVQWVKNLP